MPFDPQMLRLQFLTHGVRTAAELAEALDVSQPTISRALAQFGDELLCLGGGRSRRYALARPLEGLGAVWPLYLIGPDALPVQIGRLHSLVGGSYWLERQARGWDTLFTENFPGDIFPDLPWFLDDYRPQGFLGRAFARKHGVALGQGSNNPETWSGRVVLEAMLRYGGDFSGAFVLGAASLQEALAAHPARLHAAQREEQYPSLAERSLQGDLIGSSAGGEQPKFLVDVDPGPRQLLVKFSPPLRDAIGRRWADLLQAEHVAGRILAAEGFACARSDILDAGGRRFLEVERFDRTAQGGRLPVLSLRAFAAAILDDPFGDWSHQAEALARGGWLDSDEAGQLATLARFGRLIANTDMHAGNVSLILTPRRPLRLAPVYDMLPMAYRPHAATGEIPQEAVLGGGDRVAGRRSREFRMAAAFWDELARSSSVSVGFRRIAARHREAFRIH